MALTGDGVWLAAHIDAWTGVLDIDTDDIRVQGINATAVAALDPAAADPNLDDIAAGNRTHGATAVTPSVDAAGKITHTNLTGTLADPNNGNGGTAGLVYYKHTGTESTSRLISWTIFEGTTRAIGAVNAASDIITVNGVDATADFPAGKTIHVHGSTDVPDGIYTVASSAFTGGNTEITVNEDVTGSTADGSVVPLDLVNQDGTDDDLDGTTNGFIQLSVS